MSGLLSHPEEMKRRMLGEDMSGGLMGSAPPPSGLLTDRTGSFAGLPRDYMDRQSDNVVDMRNPSALERLMAEFRSASAILANGAHNVVTRMRPPIMSDAEMQSRLREISRLLPAQGDSVPGMLELFARRMPPIAKGGQ